MKSYSVKYTKGHLVSNENGKEKRIVLKRGQTFQITGEDESFEQKDDLVEPREIRSENEQWYDVRLKNKNRYITKILPRGVKFVFRIGLLRKTEEDSVQEFLFKGELKEDLYLHAKEDRERWSASQCTCVVKDCIEGSLSMYEPIAGYSLNNVFANVVAFYFPLQRSGACNIYKHFFITDKPDEVTLGMIKNYDLEYIHNQKDLNLYKLEILRKIINKKINDLFTIHSPLKSDTEFSINPWNYDYEEMEKTAKMIAP